MLDCFDDGAAGVATDANVIFQKPWPNRSSQGLGLPSQSRIVQLVTDSSLLLGAVDCNLSVGKNK